MDASRFTNDASRDFAQIRRAQDERWPREIAAILPGQYFVSREPMIVYTLLGSCVSACIRDPVAGVGGMNHFMLPHPNPFLPRARARARGGIEGGGDGYSISWGADSLRYGSYAMECLIDEILKRGGHESRLEVKIFGGGRVYEGGADIGAANAAWALEYLEREGLRPVTADLGDVYPRKVYYFTESGRVLLKKIERLNGRTGEA